MNTGRYNAVLQGASEHIIEDSILPDNTHCLHCIFLLSILRMPADQSNAFNKINIPLHCMWLHRSGVVHAFMIRAPDHFTAVQDFSFPMRPYSCQCPLKTKYT